MRAGGETLHRFLDQKCRDPLGPRIGVGLGIDDQSIGIGPVGDPVFIAGQTVVIVALFGAQFHRHHVAAR